MSEDSEDIIKKLTEDVPDGKATFPADEDDEFNLLLDNFIQSELKNIEEEKNNTRIMLEEPEPQPIKQNASDDEVADALELAEQKLYTAYRNSSTQSRRLPMPTAWKPRFSTSRRRFCIRAIPRASAT